MATETAGARPVDVSDVESAAETIRGLIRETPVVSAGEISRRVGATVRLKAENLQRTGSFKVRGAHNRIARLTDAELRGRGRRRERRQPCPGGRGGGEIARFPGRLLHARRAPIAKVEAVSGYGGEVRLVDGSFDEATAAARRGASRRG